MSRFASPIPTWRTLGVALVGASSGTVACSSPDLQQTCMSEPVLCPLPEGGPLATSSSSPSASPPAVTGPCDAGPPALAAATSGSCAPSFANGLNVAWVNYASDIPNPDLAVFKTVFQNTYGAGGRVARWWFHTNGSVTPGYDANGLALPISCADIADVRSILDTAYEAGVMVNISIWSFDMLEKLTPELQTNNKNLLTVDTNRQAYIDNVLTPLVTALKGHPGLYSWEIFNEPEGMATGSSYTGQGGTSVDESYIQRSVNWFAAAIHDADPSARVTATPDSSGTAAGAGRARTGPPPRDTG